jgi:hypothetical protein
MRAHHRTSRLAPIEVSSARPAVTGDICVLLAPSRPLSTSTESFLNRLRGDLGGEAVEPLHVTVDRVATDDAASLVRAVHESARHLRPAPVRVDRLYFLPSQSRGPEIVKLEVAPDAVLDEDEDEILLALRGCGLPSLYPSDRARPTITTLQRVTRRDSVEPDVSALPLELFVADRVIVSRITGLARYEILDTASIPASG